MGWSGLAFRVRWYRSSTGQRWCGSSAVGEMPEERDLLSRITGWNLVMFEQLRETNPNMERFLPRIVASIDAGVPVAAYGFCLDMSVIYGYEEGGNVLLLRDYHKGDTFKLPIAKLGPLQTFLEKQSDPMPPKDALLVSLRTAADNWTRVIGDGGVAGRGYHYGRSAFQAWVEDLDRFDEVDRNKRSSSSKSTTGISAASSTPEQPLSRSSATTRTCCRSIPCRPFEIRRHLPKGTGPFHPALRSQTSLLNPWAGESINRWTPSVREEEKGILRQALSMEEKAMQFIQHGLNAFNP